MGLASRLGLIGLPGEWAGVLFWGEDAFFVGVGVLFLGQLEAFKALVGYRRGSLAPTSLLHLLVLVLQIPLGFLRLDQLGVSPCWLCRALPKGNCLFSLLTPHLDCSMDFPGGVYQILSPSNAVK